MRSFIFFLLAFIVGKSAGAQDDAGIKWWSPQHGDDMIIEGQGWQQEPDNPYGRLPAKAKQTVRPIVWTKSQQTTGLIIRFKTNAPIVKVRYQVKGELAFEHMPATGVSGVDLYALNEKEKWEWPGFTYTFGDTIRYSFDSLRTSSIKEYHLYLPLYNQVKWIEIGVPAQNSFTALPVRSIKPVVVYGTSIVQGGCASRPGMAWTAILGRKLNRPVINLGFSGNGLLEKPIVDLLCELHASIYILDCLPNLINYRQEDIEKKIIDAVTTIRKAKPTVPIILAEHGDANISLLDMRLQKLFDGVNIAGRRAYQKLINSNVKNVHFITAKAIGLDTDATVDGSHPSDLGMMRYAEAYYNIINRFMRQ